jgi:hypothetical protein
LWSSCSFSFHGLVPPFSPLFPPLILVTYTRYIWIIFLTTLIYLLSTYLWKNYILINRPKIQEFLTYIKHLFEIIVHDRPIEYTSFPSNIIFITPIFESTTIVPTSSPSNIIVMPPLFEAILVSHSTHLARSKYVPPHQHYRSMPL